MKRLTASATVAAVAVIFLLGSTAWTDAFSGAPDDPARESDERFSPRRPFDPDAAYRNGARSSSRSGSQVQVLRCRVNLIDQVTLASDLTGILSFVGPQEGDAVEEESIVVRLMDDVPQAAYITARTLAEDEFQKMYAEASFDLAVKEVQQAEAARDEYKDAITDIELDRLKLAARRAELQIDQAVHDQKVEVLRAREAEAQLKAYKIEAPFSGVATRVYKKVGEAVRQGDPIIEIVNTDRVRVEGRIEIGDVWNIRRGNPVRVQIDIPDGLHDIEKETFEGHIVFVDETVHPVTNQVRVWAEVANRGGLLKGGLQATMTISTERAIEVEPNPAEPNKTAAGSTDATQK